MKDQWKTFMAELAMLTLIQNSDKHPNLRGWQHSYAEVGDISISLNWKQWPDRCEYEIYITEGSVGFGPCRAYDDKRIIDFLKERL